MIKDFLGREIKKGDRVVYPSYRGSMAYMNFGTIDKIVEVNLGLPNKYVTKAKIVNVLRSDGSRPHVKTLTVQSFDRMVIVWRQDGSVLTIPPSSAKI